MDIIDILLDNNRYSAQITDFISNDVGSISYSYDPEERLIIKIDRYDYNISFPRSLYVLGKLVDQPTSGNTFHFQNKRIAHINSFNNMTFKTFNCVLYSNKYNQFDLGNKSIIEG